MTSYLVPVLMGEVFGEESGDWEKSVSRRGMEVGVEDVEGVVFFRGEFLDVLSFVEVDG